MRETTLNPGHNHLHKDSIDLDFYKPKNIYSELEKISDAIKSQVPGEIIRPAPILTFDEIPILYPGTINSISGKKGCHKSRFSEHIASLLINKNATKSKLGISKNPNIQTRVVYIDTERNYKWHLAEVVKSIIINAGYKETDEDWKEIFNIYSLIDIPRIDRVSAIEAILEGERKQCDYHLFFILDVLTDCVSNFNNLDDTNAIFDKLNVFINKHDTTFLCAIHTNPESDKDRGHTGTELGNKSSNQWTIKKIYKDSKFTGFYDLIFGKARFTKDLDPIIIAYDEETNGLKIAPEGSTDTGERKSQAAEECIPFLEGYFESPDERIKHQALMDLLSNDLGLKPDATRKRITAVVDAGMRIIVDGNVYNLAKDKVKKETIYFLTLIQENFKLIPLKKEEEDLPF